MGGGGLLYRKDVFIKGTNTCAFFVYLGKSIEPRIGRLRGVCRWILERMGTLCNWSQKVGCYLTKCLCLLKPSFTFWHYFKVISYWILLICGIFIALVCSFGIFYYCHCTYICTAKLVISIIAFLAIVGLLIIWGYFIRELILNEYNYFHKFKGHLFDNRYKELKNDYEEMKKKLRQQKINI